MVLCCDDAVRSTRVMSMRPRGGGCGARSRANAPADAGTLADARDPPRTEAKAAVITARRAHIRTVMITGDHPATAEAIARELTIFEPGSRLVIGSELRTMDQAGLDAIVEQVRVFARVDPEHKLLRWTAEFRNASLLREGIGLQGVGKQDEAFEKL